MAAGGCYIIECVELQARQASATAGCNVVKEKRTRLEVGTACHRQFDKIFIIPSTRHDRGILPR